MELPKSINFPIMRPLINFLLNQLYPILGLHHIIDLNILQSYYPCLTNKSTQLKILKNLIKNSSAMCLCYQFYYSFFIYLFCYFIILVLLLEVSFCVLFFSIFSDVGSLCCLLWTIFSAL